MDPDWSEECADDSTIIRRYVEAEGRRESINTINFLIELLLWSSLPSTSLLKSNFKEVIKFSKSRSVVCRLSPR